MPGVDLLDAFAELVVCVVFNLPRDQPRQSTSSDEDGSDEDSDTGDAASSSSGTTQIFSRVNSVGESTSQPPYQTSPNTREVVGFTAASLPFSPLQTSPVPPLLSQRSGCSTPSVDMYPGGIFNPLARLQPPAAASSTSSFGMACTSPAGAAQLAMLPASVAATQHSRPSSVASLNTGDVSTPRSSGPSTDRSAGFWSRLLGGSGVLQTPPRTASFGQFPNTGLTTTASSYVQLTEEDLGAMNMSGRVVGGGMSGWTGVSTPPSSTHYASPQQQQQQDWNAAADSRGAATSSSLSTPLYEGSLGASCTQLPQQHQQQHQQQLQQLRLNPHGLYVAAQHQSSPQGGQSQASSSSEFVVL